MKTRPGPWAEVHAEKRRYDAVERRYLYGRATRAEWLAAYLRLIAARRTYLKAVRDDPKPDIVDEEKDR